MPITGSVMVAGGEYAVGQVAAARIAHGPPAAHCSGVATRLPGDFVCPDRVGNDVRAVHVRIVEAQPR